MEYFEKARAVGNFDVFYAPLNGIGMLDVLEVSKYVDEFLKNGRKNIGLDLSGLVTINSSAYNSFLQLESRIAAVKGEFALIVDNANMEEILYKYGMSHRLRVFRSEAALLNYSLREAATGNCESALVRAATVALKAVEPVKNACPLDDGSKDGLESVKEQAELPAVERPTAKIVAPFAFDDEETTGMSLWILAFVAIIGVGLLLLYLYL